MSDSKQNSPTVIGADASFKGELTFQGSVRIDGAFEGAIQTGGNVHVNNGGRLKAEVKAGSVILDGNVEGNIEAADRVELNPTSRLTGDLRAEKLVVKEGATFIGRCEVGTGAPGAPKSGLDAAMRQVQAAAQGRK
ncbi:MAG: polymer-forming cytoskeletal protein [Planctomycetota bacterium]